MKHFRLSEFDSPDLPGSGERMDKVFLQALDEARAIADVAFIINSGYRTTAHNAKVGGRSSSSHLRGHAADIRATGSVERFLIVSALLSVGINRIGIANSFIHADNDPALPKNVIWTYA